MQRSHNEDDDNKANKSLDTSRDDGSETYAFLNLDAMLSAQFQKAVPPMETQNNALDMTFDGSENAYSFLDLNAIPSFRITEQSSDSESDDEENSGKEPIGTQNNALDMTFDGSENVYAFLDLNAIPSFRITGENSGSESDDEDRYEKEPLVTQNMTKGYQDYKPSASSPYQPFDAEVRNAFQKPVLLNPSCSLDSSLNNSLECSVDEKMSNSGNRIFDGMKLFGDAVEKAKMNKNKKGEGSNGEVFELELFFKDNAETDSHLPKKCAIKTPKSKSTGANDNLKKFFRLLKKQDKNQLSQLLIPYGTFIGRPSNTVYLCMPLADFDGDTLITVIPFLSKTEKDLLVKYISYSLIKAFFTMDQLNITHGDIKPSNIMFTVQGDCLINDFDSASVFDKNGEFLHSPKQFQVDRRFNPIDELKKDDSPSVLNRKFKKLDAYRVGLSLLLICIARSDLIDEKLNLMKEQKYPSINKLLNNALDSPETIISLLNDVNADTDIIKLITALLAPSAENRLTIAAAWDQIKHFENDFNKSEIQALFSKIEGLRKVHPEDSEKEQEENKDIVVETTQLEKIFQVAAENEGEIEDNDMHEILHILSNENPSRINDELSLVLDKYQKAGKTTGGLVAETCSTFGTEGNSRVAFNSAMEGFRTNRLLGNVKRALSAKKADKEEQGRVSEAKDHPLVQSSFSTLPLPRNNSRN